MKKELKKTKIDGLLGLLLFTVFAVCVLFVLLTGADVYQKLTQMGTRTYDQRTAAQYISTRVRQADCLGAVTVEDFGGCDALVFTEDIEGELYEMKVYCYDGYIRELFSSPEDGLQPQDGDEILQAGGVSMQMKENCVLVTITDTEGEEQSLSLYLRSGKEVLQ